MEWAITAAVIALFALIGGSSKKKQPAKPADPDDKSKDDKKGAEDKKKDESKKVDPHFVPPEDGKKSDPILPARDPDPKPDIKKLPFVGPDPETKQDPDPYEPSPVPMMGEYYQVNTGDYGDPMSGVAYDAHVTHRAGWKHRAWLLVVAAPENAWIARDQSQAWGGGLYPKYSGWKTPWLSGTQHPVVFFPVLTDKQVNP